MARREVTAVAGEASRPVLESSLIRVSGPMTEWLKTMQDTRKRELGRDVSMSEVLEALRTVYESVMGGQP